MLRTSREGSCEENIFLHACQKVGLPQASTALVLRSLEQFALSFLTPVCIGGLVEKVQVLLDLLASVSKNCSLC